MLFYEGLLTTVSPREAGTHKRKAGELLFSTPINVDLMSSGEDSEVHSMNSIRGNVDRLHNRYSSFQGQLFTIEHAKVLLPLIIPKPGCSKIRLLILFFGANDSTIEGAPQHVSPFRNILMKGSIENLRIQHSRNPDIPNSQREQFQYQTPPNHIPSHLRLSLGRPRSRSRKRTATNSGTHLPLRRQSQNGRSIPQHPLRRSMDWVFKRNRLDRRRSTYREYLYPEG